MLPVIAGWLILQLTNTTLPDVGMMLFLVWIIPTCVVWYVMFNGDFDKKVEIPETCRYPKQGKIKDMDYSYKNQDEGTQIFWSVWVSNVNAFLSPYEIVLVELTNHGLVSEQELLHAKFGTAMNKYIETTTGFPAFSKVQLGWKKFVNFFREYAPSVNTITLAVLESCFIFLVDFFARFPKLFDRYIGHWMMAYHLMEECEHGHHTTKELNDGFNHFTAWLGYVWTLCLVLFMCLVLVPLQTICYFPKHALTVKGLFQLFEYLGTVMFINLYMTYGGLLFFIFRCKIADETIMQVYRRYERFVYNPYCAKPGLFNNVTPKYIQNKFKEELPEMPASPALNRMFSAPAPATPTSPSRFTFTRDEVSRAKKPLSKKA